MTDTKYVMVPVEPTDEMSIAACKSALKFPPHSRAEKYDTDGMYQHEVEVQGLYELEPVGETSLNDYGDFPPTQPIDRSSPEDLSHENGNYTCICSACGNNFQGHKRRVTCKLCESQPSDSQEEPSDTELIDWLDDNAKRFNFGFHAGLAPVGNVGIQTIGNGKTDFRSAVKAAIRSEQEKS